MTEITSAFVSRVGDWVSLSVEWDGQAEPVTVIISHPKVWQNGIVSVDRPGPTLQAFADPDDENSPTIEVENGLAAPQAAALALQVYGPNFVLDGDDPRPIKVPSMAEAKKLIRK